MIKSVMMVCVGNICRSPIAEAYFRHKCPNILVYSSGLGALSGKPAHPISIEIMKEQDIDLGQHVAQQINSMLVSKADLILAMESENIDMIHDSYPEAHGKVHLVGRWKDNQEILDPYNKDRNAFELASVLIQSGINDWVKKLAC